MDGIEEPVDLCGRTNGHVAIAEEIAGTFEKPICLPSCIFRGAGKFRRGVRPRASGALEDLWESATDDAKSVCGAPRPPVASRAGRVNVERARCRAIPEPGAS